MNKQLITRCSWCKDSEIYQLYHDTEWGVPLYDNEKLFEFLILEGAQAGLSWITILKKREGFRQAFSQFNPEKIAKFNDKKFQELLQNPNIIRNRLKITSAIQNARAYLKLQKQGIDFSEFLWSFVNHNPKVNNFETLSEIPTQTESSTAMSKALKKNGFNFVGPTICYAFMQATGMVNDHIIDCFRHQECQQ